LCEITAGIVIPTLDGKVQFQGLRLTEGIAVEGQGLSMRVTRDWAVIDGHIMVGWFPTGSHYRPM
jgi:hypothetical protein